MSKFSPELVERITKYFQQKYEVKLTPDQAQEYLHSWAALWNVVARGRSAKRAPRA